MSLAVRARYGLLNRPYTSYASRLVSPVYRARARRRPYATSGNPSKGAAPLRKEVTVTSDDGRVRWSELSTKEKAARTTQQSFNLAVVVIGAVLTAGVIAALFTSVFSPNSATAHFNRAVARIKADPRCTALLGPAKKIKAYGEPTSSRWARNRPLASSTYQDPDGTQHLLMHFNVEGPLGKGVVKLHMLKGPENFEFEYKYLALDVKGHARIYLEQQTPSKEKTQKEGPKMFGVRWS